MPSNSLAARNPLIMRIDKMSQLQAVRRIRATPRAIAEIILNVAALPEWNPALRRADTMETSARMGHPYAVASRIPGPATLTYTSVDEDRIVWELRIAGSLETGDWTLEPGKAGTLVSHTMIHRGAALNLLSRAMAPVPTWRLDRLQARAEGTP